MTAPIAQIKSLAGTTAQRAASTRVPAVGEMFLDTDTGRAGAGDGVTAAALLPHVRGTVYDRGETFQAKRDVKYGSAVLAVFGDSTGAISTRWPRLLATRLAADNTDASLGYRLWDDGSQANGTVEAVQAGTSQGTVGIKSRDTFNRTSADLRTSVADSGQTWTGSAANAAGDFSVSTSGLLRTTDTTTAGLLLDSGSAGDRIVTMAGITNWSTAAATPASVFRLYAKYVDSSNNVYGYINISTAGVVTWGVTKTIAGASTSTAGVGSILTNATAGQTIASAVVTVSGASVTMAVAGLTAVITLTSGDQSILANATVDGFQGGPLGWQTTAGGSNGFTVNVTAAMGPALTLDIYNGSFTGSVLSYQQSRLTAMCPVTPDVVVINSCHNYNAGSVSAYLTALDQFVNKVLTTWPTAGIVVMSQNPEKSPSANITPHLLRNQAIRSYCRTKGVGYIPVMEAFRAKSDLGLSLVRSDGIHPTDSTDTADASSGTVASNGAQLWTRVAYAYFSALTAASAPTT